VIDLELLVEGRVVLGLARRQIPVQSLFGAPRRLQGGLHLLAVEVDGPRQREAHFDRTRARGLHIDLEGLIGWQERLGSGGRGQQARGHHRANRTAHGPASLILLKPGTTDPASFSEFLSVIRLF
jgi:hypothetical protein